MSEFEYNESLDFLNLPQLYKGISFYPLLIKEQEEYSLMMSCFGVPKRYIKTDIDIMKASYLKFMCFYYKKKDDICNVLKHITKKDDIEIKYSVVGNVKKSDENLTLENISLSLIIDGIEFFENDFDIIRDIILKQSYSSTEYIEEYDPELEELLASSVNNKVNSQEDRMFVLSFLMRKTPQEIGELSMYQFQKLYIVSTLVETTEIYQPLLVSGQIKFEGKKKLTTYMDPLPNRTGRYDSIKMTESEFLNKVGMSGRGKDFLGENNNEKIIGNKQNIPLPKINGR